MKRNLLFAFLLIMMSVMVISCYSSRKSGVGCPTNTHSNAKFRA